MDNQTLKLMKEHRSIRKYKELMVSDKTVSTITESAQQAAFASQLYSVVYTDKKPIPFGAPLLFTFLIDLHKFERIMEIRNWKWVTNDIFSFILAIQDGSYFAQNFVLAAESLGLGTCFLGYAPYSAKKIKEDFKLPDRTFPFVLLTLGYPDEDPPVRPRYPLEYTLFKDEYPNLSDKLVNSAMKKMDEGYLKEDYYRKLNAKIPLQGEKKDPCDYSNYSWTEHICRKWGQWNSDYKKISDNLKQFGIDFKEE